jgi:hypothetical protein
VTIEMTMAMITRPKQDKIRKDKRLDWITVYAVLFLVTNGRMNFKEREREIYFSRNKENDLV